MYFVTIANYSKANNSVNSNVNVIKTCLTRNNLPDSLNSFKLDIVSDKCVLNVSISLHLKGAKTTTAYLNVLLRKP